MGASGNPRFCPRCGSVLRSEELAAARCSTCQTDLTPVLLRSATPGVDLQKVARAQRRLLYCIGAMLLLYLFNIYLEVLGGGSSLADLLVAIQSCALLMLDIVGLVLAVQLMAACGMRLLTRIVLVVLLFAPCINLLVLLGINHRATRLLRTAGVRVGLLGARDEDVLRHISSLHCRNCGYLLVGNVSGICPECGTPVADAQQH